MLHNSMLVGYTGFVGSNLNLYHDFTWRINTKNKESAYGIKPDFLVYAGVNAEKFLANKNPEVDMNKIKEAMLQIEKINPRKLVLISTVDVYKNPVLVNEDTPIDVEGLLPYGRNRFELEKWVRDFRKDALIVRLPALYGNNLKKNFIYDYIHVIPSMLKEEKYIELADKSKIIAKSYQNLNNGFWGCIVQEDNSNSVEIEKLKSAFHMVGFSAINFTDSRSTYQFYNLKNLWNDINIAIQKDIKLLNITTEPVSVTDIYQRLSDREFKNEILAYPPFYDCQTKYAQYFGGHNGYFCTGNHVLDDIVSYIQEEIR